MSRGTVVLGFHAVLSRLRRAPDSVREVYVDAGREDRRVRDLQALVTGAGIPLHRADGERLDRLADAGRHQGVVALAVALPAPRDLDDVLEGLGEPPLLLVLDGVQDPHNLGACFRVADAFGAHAIIAPKDRAVAVTATVAKVASGATDTVPFLPVTNLARALREMKERGIWIWGAAAAGTMNLDAAPLEQPAACVLGAEGTGLRRLTRESCDGLLRIPMVGQVESLNVAVAAGICLYQARLRRAASPSSP
jgi:23S rRNA (guanosine2251-2'-O)-methyltransferase